MTLREIEEKTAADMSTNAWLRELCIQIAHLNERQTPAAAPIIEKRGPGRPRLNRDSIG